MKSVIYADNAATSKIDENALDAMIPFLKEYYGNASQPYSFGRISKKALNESRSIIASSIGASTDELYFTSCGTESNNWVIKTFTHNNGIKLIITSSVEHHAILNACDAIADKVRIVKLPVNKVGEISCDKLIEVLKNETESRGIDGSRILVSIMTANNEIGTIQPIKELAEIAHKFGSFFHTDAVQAVGHIKVDVDDLNVDMLSASAHKFNGPKGIGFLYIRNGINMKPLIDGGAQENGLRAGTENVALIVGMATALKNNIDDLDINAKHVTELEKKLFQRLDEAGIDYIRNGSVNHIPGNISISFKENDGERILHRLDLKGICISTGSACDSVNPQVSHVIKAIGLDSSYAEGTIRISLGKYNNADEVDAISKELLNLIKK